MDNETREMFNLILNKMDAMQGDISAIKEDVIEIKADAKANYQELLALDKRTAEIQNKLLDIKHVTEQNCYDINLLKEKRA